MLATDPAPYTIAGAFIAGAALGVLTAIRVMRTVMRDVDRRAVRRPPEG